jgi:hypothetical protein
MDEIGSDELVATLEAVIDRFGEDMAPYAVNLCGSAAPCSSQRRGPFLGERQRA